MRRRVLRRMSFTTFSAALRVPDFMLIFHSVTVAMSLKSSVAQSALICPMGADAGHPLDLPVLRSAKLGAQRERDRNPEMIPAVIGF